MECKKLCYIALAVSLLALVFAGNPHVNQVKTGYEYSETALSELKVYADKVGYHPPYKYIRGDERKKMYCNKELEKLQFGNGFTVYGSRNGTAECIKKTPDKKPVLVVYGLHIPPWR